MLRELGGNSGLKIRFECAECGVTNPLLPTLRRHYTKTHGSHFSSDCYITLPIETNLEAWVESIISHQKHIIKIWKETGEVKSRISPSKTSIGSRRSSTSSTHPSESDELPGAVVLHDSGSEKVKFTCNICGVECRSASGLKSHTTAMHQAKYKCQLCPFSSNTGLAIRNHQISKHSKFDQPTADTLKSSKRLSLEVESASTDESSEDKAVLDPSKAVKHECSHCNFKTNLSRIFYVHCQLHVEFRDYLCQYCGKRFVSLRDGNRHSSWKHAGEPSKVVYHPLESKDKIDDDLVEDDTKLKSKIESKNVVSEIVDEKKPLTPSSSIDTKSVINYVCCHCSENGPFSFIEEHLKAQHRDLPFLVRKEGGGPMYLELYKYSCGHCLNNSVALMEAMDHWVKNHVTLSFTFNLKLFTSNVIGPSGASDLNPLLSSPKDSPSKTNTDSSTTSNPNSIILPASKTAKKPVSPKPDSSHQSDVEDSLLEEEIEESFSSDFTEEVPDEDLEANQVSSSTSDKETMVKCGYCRKIGPKKEDIYEHIRRIHSDKPMKLNVYQKNEYDRMYKGIFECGYCGEMGTTTEMQKHSQQMHVGSVPNFKRILRHKQNNKVTFRCDICGHVVKARRSITCHMQRVHPETLHSFTRLQFKSDLELPAKLPIKCNYCGDVTATNEEFDTHHKFLHSHLPPSFTNLRDEALLSIHSSTESPENKVMDSLPSCTSAVSRSSHLLQLPLPVVEKGPKLTNKKFSFTKNKARKSFPIHFLNRRQIATKSTSGRLKLVHMSHKVVNLSDDDDDGDEENVDNTLHEEEQKTLPFVPPVDASSSAYGTKLPMYNLDELYAEVNLLGGAPMRLTINQFSAVVNLNPRIVVRDCNKDNIYSLN